MRSKNKSAPQTDSRRVWFIQNTLTEGPGYLAEVLKQLKIPFHVCDRQRGEALPVIRKGDAVVVLGGPMSANDKDVFMLDLLAWTKQLLSSKVPYLGICLGLQTLVKAAGGKVEKNPVKEIGFKMENRFPFMCKKASVADGDPLLRGLPNEFQIFQLHGETVRLNRGMQNLAEGQWCKNQIVRVKKGAYGIQGHLELTRDLLSLWLREDDDLKKLNAPVQLKEFDRVGKRLQGNCRAIFVEFLKVSGWRG